MYERHKMLQLIKNFTNYFSINYNFMDSTYSNTSPEVIQYYKTEYGSDWRYAIEHDQYKKGLKKNEKSA